jgi:N-acetylglucosaminyl-diphospho-decaprenol L-rhamnosyltransferase
MRTEPSETNSPFSIVVVTWNVADELEQLLNSMSVCLEDDYELIVVDNASRDRTLDVARAWHGPIRMISLSENVGFGAANNVGVAAARYDVVIMLNPDTVLLDGSLRSLAALARRTGALCGPRVLNDDGSVQPSASTKPGGWQELVAALVPARLVPASLASRISPWRGERRREVAWLTGCCIAAPRRTLNELGPFDEEIHLYCEDLDLGLRAHERRIRSLFAPDAARIIHLGDRSAAKRFSDRGLAEIAQNRRLVVRARLGARRERLDFIIQLLGNLVRLGAKRLLRRNAERERAWLRTAGLPLL